MTPRGWGPPRTLAALIALGMCNHTLLGGSRVAVSLDALARGASPAIVGVLAVAIGASLVLYYKPQG